MENIEYLLALYLPLLMLILVMPLARMRGQLGRVYSWALALETFVTRVGQVVAWIALALIVIILFDVITRRFNMQIPGFGSTKLQELEWHIHGILFLMCLGYAYLKNAHVRIELLRDNFGMRTRAWVELLGICLLVIPYCYLMMMLGTQFANRSYLQNEVSSAMTGLPFRFIIKSFIPIGFALLTVAVLSVYLKCLVYLFGPPHLQDESGSFLRPAELAPDAADNH